MDIVRESLGDLSGGRILDVATGDGYFVNLLIKNLKDYSEVIGVDCDFSVVELAKKAFNNDKISFEYMSGDNILFDDCSFDTVSISNSLHHMENTGKTLSEMLRVLKPGGLFIINELFCDFQNEKQLTHVYLHHLQAEVETLLGITHKKTFKKQEVIDIASNLGFVGLRSFVHENEMFNRHVQIDKFTERYINIVDKIKGYPQYHKYSAILEMLIERLNRVGVEFTSQLMILGIKPER